MKTLTNSNLIKVKNEVNTAINNREATINLADFLKKIETLHPKLSKIDLEIACFIILGKNRKEIANLRGITISSMKTSRNRLRKKLELSKDILLDDYLKSFI